jgi:MFS family permease
VNVKSSEPATGRIERLRGIARALRHRNYRLFFFGQGTSLVGTWMQRVALGWLVYRLTGSEFLLGVVGFSSQILTFLVAPFAGVIADRVDRRKLLLGTQSLAMIQALILAALTLAGVITVWQIIILSLVLGLVGAFDIPTRQAFVVQMLESRKDLPNAIALNSFLVNVARLVGPSLAGLLIAATGEGICFLLNGVTYLAVIGTLFAMRVPPDPNRHRGADLLQNLKEGFGYAFGTPSIRMVLALLAFFSLVGMPYSLLLPVFAKDILNGGPDLYGFLMASTGIGAVAAGLFLASRRSVPGLERIMVVAVGMFGGSLIVFGLSRNVWLSLALLLITGVGAMTQLVGSNTLLQTIVDDDKRGRVMSFYTVCFMGMGPFGSLLMGSLASHLGAPTALMIGGGFLIGAAAVFGSRLPVLTRALESAGRETGEEEAIAMQETESVEPVPPPA